MPDKIKRIGRHVILAALAAMLAAPLSFGGVGLSPRGKKLKKQPVGTLWHVTYIGGPNAVRRDTEVELRISENTISYAAAGGRPGSEFSIPVADVTDVSDAIIEGDRAEKVFGPDEPDLYAFVSPCETLQDSSLGGWCVAGGLALYTPFAIAKFILVNMPYKDRFIRVAWQRDGEDPAVVFKVSGKDFARLRLELDRVTEKSLMNRVQGESPQEVIYDAAIAQIEEFDQEVARIHVQQWLSDQCQSSSLDMPPWLRPSPNLKTFSLCPSTPTEIDEARNQLLAK